GSEAAYRYGPASRDGIGKFYEGREISQVMGHLGAGWLERKEREREERPMDLIRALELNDDATVADIGAGTGYFSFKIAKQLPQGRVLAVDLQPEMLEKIRQRIRRTGLRNVTPVLGSALSPSLKDHSVDLALMVDAYHEFSHPFEMLRELHRAIRPGGRIVLVEYRGEDPDVAIKPLHKMTEAQVKRELTRVGFRYLKTDRRLPVQHILIFERPSKLEAPDRR
ncbi:MAG: class I SAM-dependent methyltransferase, partial [Myxococcota bacterium]